MNRRDAAVWAVLIDKFHLRPWEIAKLTDRQIHELYFHPRDKDGDIIFPREPVVSKQEHSYQNDLAGLQSMKPYMRKQDYEEALVKLKKEWDGRSN